MAASMSTFDFVETKSKILEKLERNKILNKIKTFLDKLESEISKNDETDEANRWLSWARRNQHLKVISADIPQLILPNDYEGVLHDVKVFVRFGPDDAVYDNNKDIRDRVARGNCFLELTNKTRQTSCALQAMKKFTGGLGDDDDRVSGDEMVWQKYFTKPLEETSVVIATKKANGEAAHLSCIVVDGEFILCGGSKNVHLLFKKKADIDKYVEPRYRIATEVCHTVMEFLDAMSPEDRHNLMSFLAASRFTAVFEILSPLHQHVINLSGLPKPQLKFISWTKLELQPSVDLKHLNIIPPSVGIEIARCLGLDPVDYEEVSMTNLNEHMKQARTKTGVRFIVRKPVLGSFQSGPEEEIRCVFDDILKIRHGVNSEGEVLYFLDSDGNVIGLLKKKTIWYIMCRAIREKLKAAGHRSIHKPDTFSMSKSLKQLEKRVSEIQKWLQLDDDTTQEWKDLGVKCMKWTLHELDNGGIQLSDVQDLFPVIWTKFLEATGETDQFKNTVKSTGTTDSYSTSDSAGACG